MTERPNQTPKGKKQAGAAKTGSEAPIGDSPDSKEHGASYGSHSGDMGLASREKQFRPGTGGR